MVAWIKELDEGRGSLSGMVPSPINMLFQGSQTSAEESTHRGR